MCDFSKAKITSFKTNHKENSTTYPYVISQLIKDGRIVTGGKDKTIKDFSIDPPKYLCRIGKVSDRIASIIELDNGKIVVFSIDGFYTIFIPKGKIFLFVNTNKSKFNTSSCIYPVPRNRVILLHEYGYSIIHIEPKIKEPKIDNNIFVSLYYSKRKKCFYANLHDNDDLVFLNDKTYKEEKKLFHLFIMYRTLLKK